MPPANDPEKRSITLCDTWTAPIPSMSPASKGVGRSAVENIGLRYKDRRGAVLPICGRKRRSVAENTVSRCSRFDVQSLGAAISSQGSPRLGRSIDRGIFLPTASSLSKICWRVNLAAPIGLERIIGASSTLARHGSIRDSVRRRRCEVLAASANVYSAPAKRDYLCDAKGCHGLAHALLGRHWSSHCVRCRPIPGRDAVNPEDFLCLLWSGKSRSSRGRHRGDSVIAFKCWPRMQRWREREERGRPRGIALVVAQLFRNRFACRMQEATLLSIAPRPPSITLPC